MTTSNWSLKGDYFENCNRGGCVHARSEATAEGHCDVGFAFHVDEGAFDGVALDGLNLAAVFYTPGSMPDGNWIGAAYVDERASPRQREALGEIMSGEFGGSFERFVRLTADFKGIKYVPIECKTEGRTRSVSIPQVMDFNVEGFIQPGQTEPVNVENMGTWRIGPVTVARGRQSTYVDHGMNWDNTGKVAYFGSFEWPKPCRSQ